MCNTEGDSGTVLDSRARFIGATTFGGPVGDGGGGGNLGDVELVCTSLATLVSEPLLRRKSAWLSITSAFQ